MTKGLRRLVRRVSAILNWGRIVLPSQRHVSTNADALVPHRTIDSRPLLTGPHQACQIRITRLAAGPGVARRGCARAARRRMPRPPETDDRRPLLLQLE